MTPLWDKTLEKYIRNLISPDGRNTFESTSALAQNILEKANIRDGDTVIDIGCGWGNITKQCAALTKGLVIGIEPNSDNIREALKKSESSNIQYVQGAFEQLIVSRKPMLLSVLSHFTKFLIGAKETR